MSARIGCFVGVVVFLACSADETDEASTSTGISEGTTVPSGSTGSATMPASGDASAGADGTGWTSAMGETSSSGGGPVGTSSGSDADTTGADACADGERNGDETDVDCGGSCPACPIGGACGDARDCADGVCETGSCLGPAATCDLDGVQGAPGGDGWKDSYSVDGRCYCDSTFDHDIGAIEVMTPAGMRTVLEVCEAIGPGPGAQGNPIYNDIQCGNGPPNDAGDEDWCPGRVDQGEAGCCTIGPTWDLSVFE